MKYLLVLFVFSVALFGANIDKFASANDYQRDYKSAISIAKKENKPVMLVIVGDYCPWCRKFERKTLQKKVIADEVKENFVPIIVDKKFDKDSFPQKFHAKRVPTVYFIDPKNESLFFESLGYVKKGDFLDTLNVAKSKYKGSEK